MTGGPVRLPHVQLLLVGENLWQKGYGCQPANPDQSWVALRTIGGRGSLELADGQHLRATAGTVVIFREDRLLRYEVQMDYWATYWYQFAIDDPSLLPTERILIVPERPGEIQQHMNITAGICDTITSRRFVATARFLRMLLQWVGVQSALFLGNQRGGYCRSRDSLHARPNIRRRVDCGNRRTF